MVTLETIALLIFYTLHQIFSFFGTCKTTVISGPKILVSNALDPPPPIPGISPGIFTGPSN